MQKYLILLMTAAVLSAADLPEGYRFPSETGKIVFTEDFSHGLSRWKEWCGKPGFQVVPGAGDNGSPGLVYEKKTESPHIGMLRTDFHGIPGRQYRGQVLCKIENIQDKTLPLHRLELHLMCVTHADAQGKMTGETYNVLKLNGKRDRDWGISEIRFTIPPKTVVSRFGFVGYRTKFTTGNVTFDNFQLEQLGHQQAILYPVHPRKFTIGKDGKMVFRVYDYADRSESRFTLWMKIAGKEYRSPVKNSLAEFRITVPAPGNHPCTVCLLDEREHWIAGKEEYTFMVPGTEKPPAGMAETDAEGHLRIDGKNFLPIGIFSSGEKLFTEADVRQIRDAGFNCVFPYYSMNMNLDAAGTKPMTSERLKKSLDFLHRNGLKIAFIIKEQIHGGVRQFDNVKGSLNVGEHVVRQFRRHPAILGWYITDENLMGDLPKIRELRQRVSLADPFHPVLTLTNRLSMHIPFGQTGDVLLLDSYPVLDKEKPTSMRHVRDCIVSGRTNAKMGVWFVPQAFHWGAYKKPWERFRYPTEEEMRSMVLLAMNSGAKGYGFYSHTPIFHQQEKADPGSSKKFWPEVCRTAGLLKELQEFFFVDSESLSVIREGKNFTEAKLYRSGNKILAVVTADGPGEGKARFRIPGNPVLKSRYGRTVRQKDGSYLFTGNGIASDILTNF